MIGSGSEPGVDPSELPPSEAPDVALPGWGDVPEGATLGDALEGGTRTIWFDDPDGAYLVEAALRRYLDASVVSDAILVPSDRGPALEIPAATTELRVVRALVHRFGGHIEPAQRRRSIPSESPAGVGEEAVHPPDA